MTSMICNSTVSELEKTPKVPVILTVKNEERTIGRTIGSVRRINYLNCKVAVIGIGLEYQIHAYRLNLLG